MEGVDKVIFFVGMFNYFLLRWAFIWTIPYGMVGCFQFH